MILEVFEEAPNVEVRSTIIGPYLIVEKLAIYYG